jgi:hypothetical protein
MAETADSSFPDATGWKTFRIDDPPAQPHGKPPSQAVAP